MPLGFATVPPPALFILVLIVIYLNPTHRVQTNELQFYHCPYKVTDHSPSLLPA